MKYDKEHKDSLSKYAELKECMQSLLQNGEKITPKQWKAEIQSLQSEYDSISREQIKIATELAYAENGNGIQADCRGTDNKKG